MRSGQSPSADGPAVGPEPNNLLTELGPEERRQDAARADCRLIKMVIVFLWALARRKSRGARGRGWSAVSGASCADWLCSGYLCVAFVRIINVNLS